MLSKTGLLIVLALVALFLAGCGGVKYENADSVISAAEKHTFEKCKPEFGAHPADMWGGNDASRCWVSQAGGSVEGPKSTDILTFDEDAKSACEKNRHCTQAVEHWVDAIEKWERKKRPLYSFHFTGNALIFMSSEHPPDFFDGLIADIED